MKKTKKEEYHFEGQEPQEIVEACFVRHWIVIIRDIIFFILVFAFYILLNFYFSPVFGFLEPAAYHLIITLLVVVYLHYFFLKLIKYFENVFIITNARWVEIHEDDVDFLSIREIPDIQKEQKGLLRVILNFGTLKFAYLKNVDDIPNPTYYHELVSKIKLNLIPPLSTPQPGQAQPITLERNKESTSLPSEIKQVDKSTIPLLEEENNSDEK